MIKCDIKTTGHANKIWIHDSLLIDSEVPGYLLSWVAKISQTLQPVLVFTQQPKEVLAPLIAERLAFPTFAHAIADCKRQAEVLCLVVGHETLVGTKSILWTPNTKQFGVGRYGRATAFLF